MLGFKTHTNISYTLHLHNRLYIRTFFNFKTRGAFYPCIGHLLAANIETRFSDELYGPFLSLINKQPKSTKAAPAFFLIISHILYIHLIKVSTEWS